MIAGVAKLVDARDSKSRDFGHVGSSPTSGTIVKFPNKKIDIKSND